MLAGGPTDDPVGGGVTVLRSGESVRAQHPLCLRLSVPPSPGRPLLRDVQHDPAGETVEGLRIHGREGRAATENTAREALSAVATHYRDRLLMPVGQLLGQGAAGTLALPGLEGRLLRQLQLGRPGRAAAVAGPVVA